MKKRTLSLVLCLIMVMGMALTANARWTNCGSIELDISRSNGYVTWEGAIEGNSDTTKITATYKLEKLGSNGKYTIVDTWKDSTTRTLLYSSDSVAGTAGTYRLTLTGTVQSASYSEPISKTITVLVS